MFEADHRDDSNVTYIGLWADRHPYSFNAQRYRVATRLGPMIAPDFTDEQKAQAAHNDMDLGLSRTPDVVWGEVDAALDEVADLVNQRPQDN